MYPHQASRAFELAPTTNFIRIASSRSRIEPREPTVGFTLVTDRAFAEVLVAVAPELFLAENVARRTPANWFASRAHGLLQGPGELAYVLPAAFVATALKADPKPSRLYYLAAGYVDAEGSDPIWSVAPSEWSHALRFVEIAPELHARAIASTLGVALERLSRSIEHPIHPGVGYGASGFGMSAETRSDVLWRYETTGTLGTVRIDHAFALEDQDSSEPESQPRSDLDPPQGDAPHEIEYDDGYEGAPSTAHGFESTFPAGAERPTELADDEDHYEDEASWQSALSVSDPAPSTEPDPGAILAVLQIMARGREDGSLYAAVAATPEDGVALGVLRATQRSGELGRLLDFMRKFDGTTFERCLGGAEAANALIATTTSELESTRMQPVRGSLLSDPSWLGALTRVATALTDAQKEYVKQRALLPLVPIARDLELASIKGLAMLACILVAKGLEQGMRWVLAGISPVTTDAQLQQVLPALGHSTLSAFQAAENIRETGQLDVATQARITRKLRALEAAAPVPVLAPIQMLQTLVRQAQGQAFYAKLEALFQSSLDTRNI